MQPQKSQYHFYSFALAAENKKLDTERLAVYPVEMMMFGDGELKNENVELTSEGVDKDENEYLIKVKQNSAVDAEWARLGVHNRRTPPDVRRGERLMLYRHSSDSEKLFWATLGLDDHKRRLETVIWTWSDTQDEDADATHPDNCYSIEVCTHTKQITLRTVKTDGEPFAYTIQLNTKDGRFVLTDDVGQKIKVDSAERLIHAINQDGTFFELNKEDIIFEAIRDLIGTVGRDAIAKVKRNIAITAGQDISMVAEQGNVSINAALNALVEGGVSASLKTQATSITTLPSHLEIRAATVKGFT